MPLTVALRVHLRSTSRFIPGCFFCCVLLLLIISLLSCSTAPKEKKREPKIAKMVPPVFVNAADTGFENRNDTVYFRHQFFTGYRFLLYKNGDTASVQSYFNGVEEGFQRKWYNNRQLAEERFYINGKKEGTHRGWWPDGKPKFFFTAYDNEYSGVFKEWYASGLQGKEFNYANGREEGSEKLWWDNGKVRANYVIRNIAGNGITNC